MTYSKEMLDSLRLRISGMMGDKRFRHTVEVEKMAVRIGELYAPDKLDVLRAAALLHDVSKEKSTKEHLSLLCENGIEITELDKISPKTLHARTAEFIIKSEFPEFYDEEIVLCVRRHTTADPNMSVCDMIIYLADYIDMSRTFDDCVRLRSYFWDADPRKMTQEQKYKHLLNTLILSFDMTLQSLILEGGPISRETVDARNSFICKLSK